MDRIKFRFGFQWTGQSHVRMIFDRKMDIYGITYCDDDENENGNNNYII